MVDQGDGREMEEGRRGGDDEGVKVGGEEVERVEELC